MNITILCSNPNHPVNSTLQDWISAQPADRHIVLTHNKTELAGGDILFLVSCSEILNETDRRAYKKVLVIHAGDLPHDRGWSPHIWQILEGRSEITVSLLEAADNVDSGDIWHKIKVEIPRHALYDEINRILFDTEIRLMDFAVSNFNQISPQPQSTDIKPNYRPKRSPQDSELKTDLSIAEQFNLMRVCDPDRFPAFFKLHGHKYKIRLEKMNDD